MRLTPLKVLAATALFVLGTALPATALSITPDIGKCADIAPTCLAETGTEVDTNSIDTHIENTYGVTELYKSNVDDGSEEGPAAEWYTTTYSETETDPQNALLKWGLGSFITGSPLYLLIKDGNATPTYYLFNIVWNGKDDIVMTGFWPQQGAISHVSIYGGSASVPDGGSAAALLGSALLGLGLLRRRFGRG